MVITALAVASTRLSGLGSKVHPRNIRRMLNRDVTPFMQSLSRVRQIKSRTRKRKALLGEGLHLPF